MKKFKLLSNVYFIMGKKIEDFLTILKNDCSSNDFIEEYKKYLNELNQNENMDQEVKIFKALANKIRLEIIKLLNKGPLCTCALASIFELSEGSINRHLKILEDAGLIFGKKNGYFTLYYNRDKFFKEFPKELPDLNIF